MEKRKKSTMEKLLESKKGRTVFGVASAAWCILLFYLFWKLYLVRPEMTVLDKTVFIAAFALLLAANLSIAIQGTRGFGYRFFNGRLFRRKPKKAAAPAESAPRAASAARKRKIVHRKRRKR